MAIHEIREALTLSSEVAATFVPAPSKQAIVYQKKIELNHGDYNMKHTVNHIDVFIDEVLVSSNAIVEVFVTTWPINMASDASDVFPGLSFVTTPSAANPWVLYKQSSFQNFTERREFPNQFLGSTPTFSFYTPQIYLSCVIYYPDDSIERPLELDELSASLYMAVDSKQVSSLEYGLGIYTESMKYNLGILESNGTVGLNHSGSGDFPPNRANTFPSLRFGGIRPEYMLSGNALANFWITGFNNQDAENMLNLGQMRQDYRQSKQMVAFDAAFGTEEVDGGLPDWLNMRTGINLTGAIVSQYPPLVHADNGNVRMVPPS